jgi:hypothetical protein
MQSLVCITPGKFEVLIKEMLLALKRKVFARAAVFPAELFLLFQCPFLQNL